MVGCTAAVDATANTSTTGTGVAIYWLGGTKVADTYTDFYDGSWDDEANDKNESGTDGPDTSVSGNYPITGCAHDGTESFDIVDRSLALGSSEGPTLGRPNSSTTGAGPLSSLSQQLPTATRPMYGLSAVFQVPPNTPPGASNGTVTTNEDTDYAFSETDFDFMDADPTDTLSTVGIYTLPASGKGILKFSGTAILADAEILAANIPSLTYTPPANANGAGYASFTFFVTATFRERPRRRDREPGLHDDHKRDGG